MFPALAAAHRDEWWEVGETGRNKELLALLILSNVICWGPWVPFAPPAADPAGQARVQRVFHWDLCALFQTVKETSGQEIISTLGDAEVSN